MKKTKRDRRQLWGLDLREPPPAPDIGAGLDLSGDGLDLSGDGMTVFAVLIKTDQGVTGLHSIFSREVNANRTASKLIGTDTPSGKIALAYFEPHQVDDWLTVAA